MKRTIIPFLLLVMSAGAAAAATGQADLLRDCEAAKSAGDRSGLLRIAGTFIAPEVLDDRHRSAIGACLTDGLGERWSYVPELKLFQSAAVAESFASSAAEKSTEIAARRAREEAVQRAREVLEREEQARRDRVLIATYDACVTLYRRDEATALTNPICNPIFLVNGLPD